jgi:flagellar assembly factor FliW
MLSQSAISVGQPISQATFTDTIQTRFGEISVDVSRLITFPRGLLGMPDKTNFVLTSFNSPKMEQFKLLQSLDELQLSFITLPVALDNPIIALEDIRGAADDLQISGDDLLVVLIVSVHRSPDSVRLSVNSRAPLFMDVNKKFGMQYVFQNDSYKVQHYL